MQFMKKILLSIALLSSVYLSAQTVIVNEKFEDDNEPVSFQYLPNSKKFVVYKGFGITMTLSYITTNALSFDIEGKKTVLFEKEKLVSPTFSVTENTYKAYDATKFSMKANYKFFQNNGVQIVNHDALEDLNSNFFGRYDYNNVLCAVTMRWPNVPFNASFNDVYDFGFTNQKQKDKVDFEKDDIYLERVEIKNNARKRMKLDKPDLALLKGDAFAKAELKTSFNSKLNGNENFDIITKSVSSDFQTTIVYKTTYSFDGKKIKELPFTLNLKDKFFVTSDNQGGPKDINSTPAMPGSSFSTVNVTLGTMSINHYFEDRTTGDIYFYGIYSDKATKKIDAGCNPKGFYVFKFDKEGKKVWESINAIEGKDFFERVHESAKLQVNLLEYNKNLAFSVSVNSFTEFSNAAIVGKATGSISKVSFVEYNNNTSNLRSKAFVNNSYVSDDFKNKVFSQITFVAMIVNPNIVTYLKSVSKEGKKLYYETVFSDQGIWLIQTDNKETYKVLLFKD
jgi:hypothetical protein